MKMVGKVIFFVERLLEMFRVYIWRRSDEFWLLDFIFLRFGMKICVMIWRCIRQYGFVMFCRVNGNSNLKKIYRFFGL